MSQLRKKSLGAMTKTKQEVSHFEFIVAFWCNLCNFHVSHFNELLLAGSSVPHKNRSAWTKDLNYEKLSKILSFRKMAWPWRGVKLQRKTGSDTRSWLVDIWFRNNLCMPWHTELWVVSSDLVWSPPSSLVLVSPAHSKQEVILTADWSIFDSVVSLQWYDIQSCGWCHRTWFGVLHLH